MPDNARFLQATQIQRTYRHERLLDTILTAVENATSRLLDAVLNGRRNTAGEWLAYFQEFHDAYPTANDLFTLLRDEHGCTSYERLALEARPDDEMLEVGCGDGNLVEALLDRLGTGARWITATTISESELSVALGRYGGSPNLTLELADAADLPYQSASFDLVLAHQFFNFLPDPKRYFAEAARVLRKGGRLTFVTNRGWQNDRDNTWIELHTAAVERLRSFYPHFVWPDMEDRRIYDDDGIANLLGESIAFARDTLEITPFTAHAYMTPDRAAAIYNRLYLFSSVPERERIVEAVQRKAETLAEFDGRLDVQLPFRLVKIARR